LTPTRITNISRLLFLKFQRSAVHLDATGISRNLAQAASMVERPSVDGLNHQLKRIQSMKSKNDLH